MFQKVKDLVFCDAVKRHLANFKPLKDLLKHYGLVPIGILLGACAIQELVPVIYDFFKEDSYYDVIYDVLGGGAKAPTILVALDFVMTFVITYLIANATFHSFETALTERRKVSVGEFFSYTIEDFKTYFIKHLLMVTLPLFVLSLLGSLLSFIPFVTGIRFFGIIGTFLGYLLLFKFVAYLADENREGIELEYAYYWFIYAVFAYLLTSLFTFATLGIALQVIFIPYALLVLYRRTSIA